MTTSINDTFISLGPGAWRDWLPKAFYGLVIIIIQGKIKSKPFIQL